MTLWKKRNVNQHIIALKKETKLNRKVFAEHFGILFRTIEDWEAGRRPPEYVPRLIKYQIEYEKLLSMHMRRKEYHGRIFKAAENGVI